MMRVDAACRLPETVHRRVDRRGGLDGHPSSRRRSPSSSTACSCREASVPALRRGSSSPASSPGSRADRPVADGGSRAAPQLRGRPSRGAAAVLEEPQGGRSGASPRRSSSSAECGAAAFTPTEAAVVAAFYHGLLRRRRDLPLAQSWRDVLGSLGGAAEISAVILLVVALASASSRVEQAARSAPSIISQKSLVAPARSEVTASSSASPVLLLVAGMFLDAISNLWLHFPAAARAPSRCSFNWNLAWFGVVITDEPRHRPVPPAARRES